MRIQYPAIGLGTYPLQGDLCYQAVAKAIDIGYQIIDTATYYKNFDSIGKAIKKIGRNELYVISKVWPTAHTKNGIFQDIEQTLKNLQTDYLDAYLLHWPNSSVDIEETLFAMREIQQKGLIRHIGLSNITIYHLQRAMETGNSIDCVQNEMNPFFYDNALLQFCHTQKIGFQAWAPLGRGRARSNELLQRLAKKYNKTEAQIALYWIFQHGCIPLPGSSNPHHMQLNFQCSDFLLSQSDMEEINQHASIGSRERIIPEWDLGFSDEFDFSYHQCWPKK